MFDFFSQILGFLELLWDFVVNLFTMLITLITTLIGAVQLPVELSISVPSVLGSCIMITLAVYVAKFFVGR